MTDWSCIVRDIETEWERNRLRRAIRDSGYAVMRTSGGWSLHDVSEAAVREQERTLEVINENLDLRSENRILSARLSAALGSAEAAERILAKERGA